MSSLIVSWACFWFYQEKFDLWNSQIIDRLVLFRPKIMPTPSQVIHPVVYVDANLYFSRSSHAKVIRNLSSMKVSALSIDFIFDNKVDHAEDRALINATADAAKVFLGLSFNLLSDSLAPAKTIFSQEKTKVMDTTKWQVVVDGSTKWFYVGAKPHIPFPELSMASKGLGFINATPDPDGILRRVPVLVRYQDAFYPSLPFRVVCDYLGVTPDQISIKAGVSITLKGIKKSDSYSSTEIVIPTDRHGNMILSDPSFETQSKHYSYKQVSQAPEQPSDMEKLKQELTGKIVVMSETVEKPFKIRSEVLLPLAAVHGTIIQKILSQSFLRLVPNAAMHLIELLILTIILSLSIRFNSLPLSMGTLFIAGVYAVIGVLFFFTGGLIFQFARSFFLLLCTLTFLLFGLGIEKALLFAETEKARRLAERELEIGREIQSGFFPTALPEATGWELKVYFQAARHVAGDFYDAFTLGQEKKIGIVVADVCDKGVGAALFMALFRSFIRVLSGQAVSENHLNADTNPMEILRKTFRSINNYISITHEKAGMFATLFYCIINPDTGDFYYINGGHEPPLIIGRSKIKARLNPTGPAVGLQPYLNHPVGNATLAKGDTLLVFTDGVVDAQNKDSQPFTKERLEKILWAPFNSADELIEKIMNQIDKHISGAEPFDDITIAVLHRKK